MSLGFPGTDLDSEREAGSESFWPSFTDIMMVIVMTFLLITVVVILNNWELVNSLKESVTAEKQASAKAQSALQVIQAKSVENETLDNRVLRLEALLRERSVSINAMTASLGASQQQLDKKKDQLAMLANKQAATEEELAQLQQQLSQQIQARLDAEQAQLQSQQSLVRVKNEKTEQEQQIQDLQNKLNKQAEEKEAVLAALREQLEASEQSLQSTIADLTTLKEKVVNGNQALVSLQGEFTALDKKYQKLLRPARSAKNKHVVKVILEKSGREQRYQVLDQEEAAINTQSRQQLNKILTRLKQEYGNDLYVKIIIPKSSRISHSEAWRFTSDILKQYDYYHSGEDSEL